jgi:hypothetical protein
MIFCPPGLGKSTISSKAFPSYCLGKVPERKIIVTSYGADLANDFGRKTKQLVESQLYKNVFHDFQLSKDKKE